MRLDGIDPRDPEQLGRLIYDSYHNAAGRHGADRAPSWEQAGEDERARWQQVARDIHERFAPDSAADVPMGASW